MELLELDHGGSLTRQSVRSLITMAEAWCPALLELGRNEQAEAVCETAWNENRCNQKLTRQLYEMKITSGATMQGRRIMDAFAAASRELGLDEGTVEELSHQITSPPG